MWEAARKPVSGTDIREKQSVSRIFQVKSWDKQETWYPTLQKTVWVLSQLHEFVKVCRCVIAHSYSAVFLTLHREQPAIFDELAQEAIKYCLQTLLSAAETLKSKNPPTSVYDGHLFLLRHLLILKEMTQNLDLVHRDVERGSALSGVPGKSDALTRVYSPRSRFSQNHWLRCSAGLHRFSRTPSSLPSGCRVTRIRATCAT